MGSLWRALQVIDEFSFTLRAIGSCGGDSKQERVIICHVLIWTLGLMRYRTFSKHKWTLLHLGLARKTGLGVTLSLKRRPGPRPCPQPCALPPLGP